MEHVRTIRRRFVFYGRVQGVGFRYHASHKARSLGITGWVRNEYDGSVTLEAQGPEECLDMLLAHLMNDRYIGIDDYTCEALPVDENEWTFGVEGY